MSRRYTVPVLILVLLVRDCFLILYRVHEFEYGSLENTPIRIDNTVVGDFWSLYMTDEILDELVLHTNESIEEDFIGKAYDADYLSKAPHLKLTDKVQMFVLVFCSGLVTRLAAPVYESQIRIGITGFKCMDCLPL